MAKKKTTKKKTTKARKTVAANATSRGKKTTRKVAAKTRRKVTKKASKPGPEKKMTKKSPPRKTSTKAPAKKTKVAQTAKTTKKAKATKATKAAKVTKAAKSAATKPTKPIPVKTSLTRKELDYFRKLLLEKRAELVGDLDTMGNEALKQDSANLSHYADHMADIGSDNFEQELTLGLMESERRLLQEIDAALDRIANRTYGICELTGKPIGKPRLEAKPWAKYSIDAARELERNGNNGQI